MQGSAGRSVKSQSRLLLVILLCEIPEQQQPGEPHCRQRAVARQWALAQAVEYTRTTCGPAKDPSRQLRTSTERELRIEHSEPCVEQYQRQDKLVGGRSSRQPSATKSAVPNTQRHSDKHASRTQPRQNDFGRPSNVCRDGQ